MKAHELVTMGEGIASGLVEEARIKGVAYADLLQGVQIALRLLRKTYGGDALQLAQYADAAFAAVVTPDGTSN